MICEKKKTRKIRLLFILLSLANATLCRRKEGDKIKRSIRSDLRRKERFSLERTLRSKFLGAYQEFCFRVTIKKRRRTERFDSPSFRDGGEVISRSREGALDAKPKRFQ